MEGKVTNGAGERRSSSVVGCDISRILGLLFQYFKIIRLNVCILYAQSLAPTNKVWGKVIFSEACVSHSVHRGSLYDVTSCQDDWSHDPSRELCLCPGWSLSGGLCLEVVSAKGDPSVW